MPSAVAMVAFTLADRFGAGGVVVPLHSGATGPSEPVLTKVPSCDRPAK